jgi:predicted nucleic acid-binding protein
MAIDPSNFHKNNVIDTCAIWNLLSSKLLYTTSQKAGCQFCFTYFVYYECLHKPRKDPKPEEIELQDRFRHEYNNRNNNQWQCHHLTIEDLQDVEVLQKRMNIDKGELASITYAKKTGKAFLTDDQKARELAAQFITAKMVQTTPHLLSWLLFISYLSDSDLQPIIKEHKYFYRPLEKYFSKVYRMVLDYKLKAFSNTTTE